jgi:hypothetical protein
MTEIAFNINENDLPVEVLRIEKEGVVFWRGKLVEGNDEFKKAMMDLASKIHVLGELQKRDRAIEELVNKYKRLETTVLLDTGFSDIEEYLEDLERK